MTLPTRALGRAGMNITVLGAGTWVFGGPNFKYSWGAQDDATSVRAIRHAVAAGVNWIDTAPIYGRGHAEEMVGVALKGIPAGERPYIFSKCGLRWSNSDPMGEPQNNLRPVSIRMECEASLRRLGVERLDLLQFHWPDPSTPVEDSWAELCKLVDEGKVRAPAVSNFDVGLLERCEAIRHVECLQPPFSMLARDAGQELLDWCADHETGVICYSPLRSGLLTDSFSAERVALMDPRDWRAWQANLAEEFDEPRLSRNLALRDSLKPIAARHGTNVIAIALGWVLAWRGVTGAIVGSRTADQIDGWIGGATVRLSDQDLDEIQASIERLGVGSGPGRPHRRRAAV